MALGGMGWVRLSSIRQDWVPLGTRCVLRFHAAAAAAGGDFLKSNGCVTAVLFSWSAERWAGCGWAGVGWAAEEILGNRLLRTGEDRCVLPCVIGAEAWGRRGLGSLWSFPAALAMQNAPDMVVCGVGGWRGAAPSAVGLPSRAQILCGKRAPKAH